MTINPAVTGCIEFQKLPDEWIVRLPE